MQQQSPQHLSQQHSNVSNNCNGSVTSNIISPNNINVSSSAAAAAAILQAASAVKNNNTLGTTSSTLFGLSQHPSVTVTSASTILGLANLMAAAKRSSGSGCVTPTKMLQTPNSDIFQQHSGNETLSSFTPQPSGQHASVSRQLSSSIPSVVNNSITSQTGIVASPLGGVLRRSPMLSQLVYE